MMLTSYKKYFLERSYLLPRSMLRQCTEVWDQNEGYENEQFAIVRGERTKRFFAFAKEQDLFSKQRFMEKTR